MLRTITIDGFKSIQHLSLGLGRVNCLIGANGVGKSNILEAIGVLGAAANGTVDDEALLRRGVRPGLPRLYKSSFASAQTPAHISLSAADAESTDAGGAVFRISLLNPLDNPNPAWHFKTEYLFDGRDEIVSDGIRGSKNLTKDKGLSALKLVELDPGNKAARLMAQLQNYAIYTPSTATLRGMGRCLQGVPRIMVDLECALTMEARLTNLPKGRRIRKTKPQYQGYAATVRDSWSRIAALCTQARRFQDELSIRVNS